MTRTILGPDGEQQRVTVERDFKNENELNVFLKQFGENMNKNSSNTPKAKKQTGSFHSSFSKLNKSDTEDLIKSPGCVDFSVFYLFLFCWNNHAFVLVE